nr:zinc finger BED domain-containing protein RICESLEEPER 2-like [Ipomoea batatas]
MEDDNSHVGGCDSFSPTPMSSPIEYPNSSPVDSPSGRNEAETQGTSQTVEGELEPKVGDKRLRSTVWEHFTKIQVNGLNKAECKYCKKLLGGESKNGTKHLHDHHKICRMRPYQPLRQQTLTFNKDKDGNVNVNNYTFDPIATRQGLGRMIVKHEYSLNMVEHSGFREFMQLAQPLFKVPSRNTIRSDILKQYEGSEDYEIDEDLLLPQQLEA